MQNRKYGGKTVVFFFFGQQQSYFLVSSVRKQNDKEVWRFSGRQFSIGDQHTRLVFLLQTQNKPIRVKHNKLS